MNGMDLLMQSVMKASGVNPETVKDQIIDYGNRLSAKITSMDAALQRITDEQDAIRHQVEQLRVAHGLASDLLMTIAERLGAITSIEVAPGKNGTGGKNDGATTAAGKHRTG